MNLNGPITCGAVFPVPPVLWGVCHSPDLRLVLLWDLEIDAGVTETTQRVTLPWTTSAYATVTSPLNVKGNHRFCLSLLETKGSGS